MAAESYPNVRFEGEKLEGDCTPAALRLVDSCKALYSGKLTIRDVTKQVHIPVELKEEDRFGDQHAVVVRGEFPIQWAEYHVDDPSVLVAKLDSTAVINFEVTLHRMPDALAKEGRGPLQKRSS